MISTLATLGLESVSRKIKHAITQFDFFLIFARNMDWIGLGLEHGPLHLISLTYVNVWGWIRLDHYFTPMDRCFSINLSTFPPLRWQVFHLYPRKKTKNSNTNVPKPFLYQLQRSINLSYKFLNNPVFFGTACWKFFLHQFLDLSHHLSFLNSINVKCDIGIHCFDLRMKNVKFSQWYHDFLSPWFACILNLS